jgi:undecaprenyl-phosphate 4-deoxy-4-formamido-L-arabinose transferase
MSGRSHEHTISVVVPVYRGATTIEDLVEQLAEWHEAFTTAAGHVARVDEVLLVHDCGPDESDDAIRRLTVTHDWVRAIWLSRNYGQHAATLAGMASSGGCWVVTMDEDGQHDPGDLGPMLDRAMAEQADVVYAAGVNKPPHGLLRNVASRLAKRSVHLMTGNPQTADFNSFRFILGEIARSVAAYSGSGVYLDVALGWVAGRITTCPVRLRIGSNRPSGYGFRSLLSHYWRMVVTSGTRLLRMVSLIGMALALAGFAFAVYTIAARTLGLVTVEGWASVMVVVLIGVGVVLFALGVVAEYVGVAVNMAMGKPLYLMVTDRSEGPHGWAPASREPL